MRPLNTWLGSNAPQLVGIGASLGLLAGFAVLFVMGHAQRRRWVEQG